MAGGCESAHQVWEILNREERVVEGSLTLKVLWGSWPIFPPLVMLLSPLTVGNMEGTRLSPHRLWCKVTPAYETVTFPYLQLQWEEGKALKRPMKTAWC